MPRFHWRVPATHRLWLVSAFVLLGLSSIVFSVGCSTHAQRIRSAREHFYSGQLADSAELFETHIDRYPRDADVAMLDLAIVQLLNGAPREAEHSLRTVRDHFDALQQPAIGEQAVSMLTDEQHQSYSGEGYEKVLIRVMLTLANLLDDGQDAEAYSLQINAKQQELMRQATDEQVDGAQLAYAPLAIGPYVHGLLREATFQNYDDAARAYHQVVSWQPGFRSGQLDLQRAERGAHSQPGHGVLYVFALVDRGPIKEETVEIPTSQALLIADRILSFAGQYQLPPTIAPIKIPTVVVPQREVDHAVVLADGNPVGRTEVVCDIAEMAIREQEVQRPRILARAVARRVIKKATVYAAKDSFQVDNPWTDLAMTAAGVVWEATEAADTRCWGVLPREIQVLRVELPAGSHRVALQPQLVGQRPGEMQVADVQVVDGRNTYVLAYLVGHGAIGQIAQKTP